MTFDKLMLLCTKHHTPVHEGSFRIDTDFQDHWTFMRPDGIVVAAAGYHSRDRLDTETGEISGLYGNPPAGVLLSGEENFVKEQLAPVYFH